ncbi:MAG: helix-turn-helix domain-containing protein [Hyphomicrobium sp.]
MIDAHCHKLSISSSFQVSRGLRIVVEMGKLPNTLIHMPKLLATRRSGFASRTRREVTTDISRLIGKNLREARKLSGYSLETLAQKSGVSRAMLGQIETAKSVPTVTVIWRIAEALEISTSSLISRTTSEPALVVHPDGRASSRSPAVRPLLPPGRSEEPRFFEVRIEGGRTEAFPGYPATLRVTLALVRGRIRVDFQSAPSIELSEGDVGFFDGQQDHSVENIGDQQALAYVTLTPKRGP